MQASNFTSSPTWIRNFERMRAISNLGYADTTELHTVIQAEDIEKVKKGMRQFDFWNKRLSVQAQEKTAIIALLGSEGLVRPNVLQICQALQSVCDMSKLVNVVLTPNVNFIGLSFANEGEKELILRSFLSFDNCLVLHVGANASNTLRYKILWLPPFFEDSYVRNLLNKYAASYTLSHEYIQTDTETFTTTNVVKGNLTLKTGMRGDQVPHLIQLPAPYQGCALITLEGREQMCLKCRRFGHVRRQCFAKRCLKCFAMHEAGNECSVRSFSEVTAGFNSSRESEDWLSDAELNDGDSINDSLSDKEESIDTDIKTVDTGAKPKSNDAMSTDTVTVREIPDKAGSNSRESVKVDFDNCALLDGPIVSDKREHDPAKGRRKGGTKVEGLIEKDEIIIKKKKEEKRGNENRVNENYDIKKTCLLDNLGPLQSMHTRSQSSFGIKRQGREDKNDENGSDEEQSKKVLKINSGGKKGEGKNK